MLLISLVQCCVNATVSLPFQEVVLIEQHYVLIWHYLVWEVGGRVVAADPCSLPDCAGHIPFSFFIPIYK